MAGEIIRLTADNNQEGMTIEELETLLADPETMVRFRDAEDGHVAYTVWSLEHPKDETTIVVDAYTRAAELLSDEAWERGK